MKDKIIGYYGYWVFLTYLSLISAIIGIYFSVRGNIFLAIVCLMISGVCDMFDGTVAKTKKRNDDQERYGIQIDALSDIVAFSVLPISIGFAIYKNVMFQSEMSFITIFNLFVFALLVLCALIRLAYFNVDEMKLKDGNVVRKYYEGLPVTSVALIIPFVYLICNILNISLDKIFNILYLLIAILFVVRIKIPKIRGKKLFILLFIGVILFILMILFKFFI